MRQLALNFVQPCDETIRHNSNNESFHCWDMASGMDDGVPDGVINAFDYRFQKKLPYLRQAQETHLRLLPNSPIRYYPERKNGCDAAAPPTRRQLQHVASGGATATIVSEWGGFTCAPQELGLDRCYYDCNSHPRCRHSMTPVLSSSESGGQWYSVPLPTLWTALSMKFEQGMEKCENVAAGTMCIELDASTSSCAEQNFEVRMRDEPSRQLCFEEAAAAATLLWLRWRLLTGHWFATRTAGQPTVKDGDCCADEWSQQLPVQCSCALLRSVRTEPAPRFPRGAGPTPSDLGGAPRRHVWHSLP
jgi:hypothetical protein